eukprot:15472-Heterococcus_DN1.PRE.1
MSSSYLIRPAVAGADSIDRLSIGSAVHSNHTTSMPHGVGGTVTGVALVGVVYSHCSCTRSSRAFRKSVSMHNAEVRELRQCVDSRTSD